MTKELDLLIKGRNSLITAILSLQNNYFVYDLEELRDEVNRKIKELKERGIK